MRFFSIDKAANPFLSIVDPILLTYSVWLAVLYANKSGRGNAMDRHNTEPFVRRKSSFQKAP